MPDVYVDTAQLFSGLSEGYVYEEDLDLSFDDFVWERYQEGERTILQPQLEEDWGFTVTGWFTGDGDSFGPLTRCARLKDKDGSRYTFVYG